MVAAGASLVGLGLVMGFSPSMYAVVLHLLTTEIYTILFVGSVRCV